MRDVMTVASYICGRYQRENGEKIDEMKTFLARIGL